MPLTVADIEKECLAGIPKERENRMDQAAKNSLYFKGDFTLDTQQWRMPPESLRTSLIMQRVVTTLTQNLYRTGPTRILPDYPQVQEWLEAVYKKHRIDALWRAADEQSLINEIAAFRVMGRVDKPGAAANKTPVDITLWGGDELAVWMEPENRLEVMAVATWEVYDNQKRIRLYTPDEITDFVTEKFEGTNGGAAFRLDKRVPNPYGRIPFAFVNFKVPTIDFFSGSPGDHLQKLNYHVNYRLSDLADHIIHTRPIGTINGAASEWNFPKGMRPGQWTTIPGVVSASETLTEGRAEYVNPDLSFVEVDWTDLNHHIDHALEMIGCPPSTIRMEESSVKSGFALVQEQQPIILWAESRQPTFNLYEDGLAELVLTVASIHAEINGRDALRGVSRGLLAEAAEDLNLTLKWPDMNVRVPGTETDASDQFRLDNSLTSRTQLLMERHKFTREEAEEEFEDIAEDLASEAKALQAANPMMQLGPDGLPINVNAPPDETETEDDGGDTADGALTAEANA